jgi:hypothetical protein
MAARNISTTWLRTGAATAATRRISEFVIVRSVAMASFLDQSANMSTATRCPLLSPFSPPH